MSRTLRKQVLTMTGLLKKANRALKVILTQKNIDQENVLKLLTDCQETAITIGQELENIYGEGTESVRKLEEYCESLYQMTLALSDPEKRRSILRDLTGQIQQFQHLVSEQISNKLEIVFLPYKASMWDSLESVWMAADADENCETYVVPIPYYERNPNGTFNKYHYEGEEFPDYVPVTYYENYEIEKRWPDIVYIHNPYDQYNYVTSVDPRFYSYELKKRTDMLVYIPYYSTAGGMSEAQATCSAYYQVDRVIIQAEKYRKFFDANLPQEKLLPMGSPKFDRIIRICNNPPEPPVEWKDKLEGRKVYFYNTSLGGMLANTEAFLKKMEYVFSCFKDREDSCLLWRPHPLFESTLESMRPTFKPAFDLLKTYFLENELGIYDDTPDITNTIALCDAYIGDTGTSVTSLFGIAGKPLFILDNNIHTLPEPEDWKGKIIPGFSITGDPSWMITQGNKLYHAPDGDYKYRYCCDLSEYAYGNYYSQVITIGERQYVCPANAQDIIVIHNEKIEKRILLEQRIEQTGAFCGAISCGKYVFLVPYNYPALVRFNTENEEIRYLDQHLDIFIKTVNGDKCVGGYCVQNGSLYLASPDDNQILQICVETGEEHLLTAGSEKCSGYNVLISDGTNLWLLPFFGKTIIKWNPIDGTFEEYSDYPKNMTCSHIIHGYSCTEHLFNLPAFCEDYIYFPPYWANMFIRLDRKTGKLTNWVPPFELPEKQLNGYFSSWGKGYFLPTAESASANKYHFFSIFDRKLYLIDLKTNEYNEIPIEFSSDELKKHEPGFQRNSEWLQYACEENIFNTLPDFLNGTITGNPFNREKQMQAFHEIAANNDGTCGKKVHQLLCSQFPR